MAVDDNDEENETTFLLSKVSNKEKDFSILHKDASRSRKACILAACFLLQLISNGIGFGLGVMYVEVMRVFEAPRSTAVLIQSLFMAITTAGGILWAPAFARFGAGRCTFVGGILSSLGLFTTAFVSSITLVIVLTGVVASLGMSINYLAAFVVASSTFREKAGVPLVFLTTGSSIGQFIFPYMYEIFITTYGWAGAFMMLAGLSLQCIPAAVVIHVSRDYMVSKVTNKKDGCGICNCDWALLSQATILLLLSNQLLLAATGNLEAWFLVDLMTTRGFERQTGSLFVSLLGLCNFFGRLTGVVLRLKVRLPTIYHWLYCVPLLGASHVMILKFTTYWPLLVACLLYGYIFGIVAAQTPAIMLEVAGLKRYADGMAFVNIFNGIGNLLGGTLGGITKDTYGEYDPMFYTATGACFYVTVTSSIIVYVSRRKNIQGWINL